MSPGSSSLIDDLLGKRLVLVTGKGGIGKTLVAAALGQAAAERAAGRASPSRSLIVESSLTDQVAPLFGQPPIGHNETLLAPGLFGINLDPPLNFRDYVVKYLRQPALYERVFSNRLVRSFIDTVPGFSELMMLGRIFYAAEVAPAPRASFLVFDGFASGHFLSLMTTPDAVLSAGFGGPLARETERVRAFLADPDKTAVVYVVTPEELVVSEALDFLPRLIAKSPARLSGVIVNRLQPGAFPRPVTAAGEPAAAPALAEFLAARRARADAALRTLRDGLAALAAEGQRLATWVLADLGAPPEPLPPAFGRDWLGGGQPL